MSLEQNQPPKAWFGVLRNLTQIAQLGLNMALPLVLGVAGSLWLQKKFSLGSWVVLLGILLGLLGVAGGLWQFCRQALAQARRRGETGDDGTTRSS